MAFLQEQKQALHLLEGIENGTLSASQASQEIESADPALVYFIVTWLRSRYGSDHPAAEGVVGRLVELTDSYASVKSKIDEGKKDSVVDWFEDEYSYRDLSSQEFIAIVVEKLEG